MEWQYVSHQKGFKYVNRGEKSLFENIFHNHVLLIFLALVLLDCY